MSKFILDKPIKIGIWANGEFAFSASKLTGALPVHSVDTVEMARTLQILCCQTVGNHYVITSASGFNGTIDSLPSVARFLQAAEQVIAEAREEA
jgi:hypothetical protein